MNKDFWRNRKVLLTGHTGFKGGWLSLWLQHLGADVVGYSLAPPTQPNLFEKAKVADGMHSVLGDIRDSDSLLTLLSDEKPEIVFHLAAQPLVRESYEDPRYTYETNVIGSLNVLEAVRQNDSVRAVVMVSTDKCYENKEWVWGYRETDPMGGHDPYSSSKACAELLVASYRASYFNAKNYLQHKTAIATARAGNVIGGGDWAMDRLFPDIIKAANQNRPIDLRFPNAIRPWQHVLEPLSGYIKLAECLVSDGMQFADGWNFGPGPESSKTVKWITEHLVDALGSSTKVTTNSNNQPHEASNLTLECSKAANLLNWHPRWDLETALDKVVTWTHADQQGKDLREACIQQIEEYSVSQV